MDEQSPDISSSHSGDERREPAQPGERKPWDDLDDVLDLTGGAGQFSQPFSGSHPARDIEEEEEDEEEERGAWKDSLEPSPVEEEPGSIDSISPVSPHSPAVPSAPMEEPERPPAPCTAPSGSVDENLFTLPAASAHLMHASADKIMEPYSTVSTGQEEFASVLLQSTASLSSLPSLSTDSSKEHAETVAFPTGLAATEALQEPTDNMYSVSRITSHLPLSDNLESKALDQVKEEVIFSEKGYVVDHPTSQQETISEEHAKLYSQSAKEMFSGMLQSVAPPHEEFTDIKEVYDPYVDFKPFMSSKSGDVGYEVSDVAEKFQVDVGRLNLESAVKHEEKSSEEMEIDSISDDISPLTPELLPDSTDYDMFATVEQNIPFSFGGGHVAGNKTDEKKIEDIEAQKTSVGFGLKVATVNPFYNESAQESEYVTTHVATHVSTKPEGPTPDIVQEAYESEAYDTGIPKQKYESNIDLVQTAANSVQEKVSPTAQAPARLEETDSVSSPVLPDIVMEAPLASALETVALKPDISPVGIKPPARVEKTKAEPEKPPSYEEAVTEVLQNQDLAAALGGSKQGAVVEETETPYISIACDLIKGTESVASGFTEFSKLKQNEFESQFMEPSDESSPDSECSEPSYKQWDSEVVQKEAFSIKTESVNAQSIIIPEQKQVFDQKSEESSPSKSYLDSFQPEICVSKATSDLFAKGLTTLLQEKPLQMEELDEGLSLEKIPCTKYSPVSESPEPRPSPVPEDLSSKLGDIQKEVLIAKQPEDKVQKNRSNLDFVPENIEFTPAVQKPDDSGKAVSDTFGGLDTTTKGGSAVHEVKVDKPKPPSKEDDGSKLPKKESKASTVSSSDFMNSVVDLIYWRDIKRSGVVFGASLFLLLSLSVFSIVSVLAYIALALLSVTISLRIYKGILQAIQKSEEGHPFRSILESNLAVPEDLVQKYCNVALNHVNCTVKELRHLFLVEDLVDSLKFAVLMWVFTYIGALFNGLTLLIVALISLFSIPVIYERHQTQVDHYLALVNKNLKSTSDLILSKVPGLKRKAE
uniref:Reticulon n=1 Tax=Xenopus laevis TaxID=8355 RepID=Q6JRV0_XENLA|nr:RTN4.1-A1 [Xenopus laevis]